MSAQQGIVLNLNADPPIDPARGWRMLTHFRGGILRWKTERLWTYRPVYVTWRGEKGLEHVRGEHILYDLAVFPVANANVAYFLYGRQHLIPNALRASSLYFLGTHFEEEKGYGRYVISLHWERQIRQWVLSDKLLDCDDWGRRCRFVMCTGSQGLLGERVEIDLSKPSE